MRANDVGGRKVISTATAATLGKVDSLVVDAAAQRVVAVRLKKTEGDGDTLLWGDIASFGADAITVASDDVVRVADGSVSTLADKHHHLIGKRVLTQAGEELGKAKDLEFDPADGTIRAVVVEHAEVPGTDLVAVGSYAVIVRA